MRVLLLGATGNLGRRCIPALLAHNHTVVVYVRNPSKLRLIVSTSVIDSLEAIVVGDATDHIGIKNTILEYNVEGIIDVAGTQVKRGEEFLMSKIARAVSNAAIAIADEGGKPLRAWICCGLGVLEYPGSGGYLVEDYMPKRLSEQHRATCDVIESVSLSKLQWSIICVAFMVPGASEQVVHVLDTPRTHNLIVTAGAPPDFKSSWLAKIPWLGLWLDFWLRWLWSYSTKYEDVADFLADDVKSEHSLWVGKKVGMKEKNKVKLT